jgi:hypothetical protein
MEEHIVAENRGGAAKKAASKAESGDDQNKSGGEVPPSKEGEASQPDQNIQKSSATSLQGSDEEAEGGTTSAQAGTQPQATHLPRDKSTGHVVNSGPETGVPVPADPTPDRYPSTVLAPSESGPIEPPPDFRTQGVPEGGYSLSSTDPVWAHAGGRTIAGEDYVGLVGDDGNKVDPGSLFDMGDGSKTVVTAKQTVWEEFVYPNTVVVSKRRLYSAGAVVPRARAAALVAAVENAPEPADADKIG